MATDRWQRIEEIFHDVKELPAEERSAALGRWCGSDEGLRSEVEALLGAHQAMSSGSPSSDGIGERVERATFELERGPSLEGTAVGPYRILRVLGYGGMGAVYEAEQQNPRRRVALKVIRSGLLTPALLRRFELEVEWLGQLQHPGIAQIHEAGTSESGEPYFAMELVDGRPLLDYAKEEALPLRARLELFLEVCEAVQHAHQRGVIHRDLKPANILVTAEGRPKVLDFGIARATDADLQVGTLQTQIGQLIGTLPYMSPEQASGDPLQLDLRSDVYALGVILYQLLTERLPHDLKDLVLHEAVRVIQQEEPRRLGSEDSRLRGDLETIVAKALEKEKDRRYSSVPALADDVQRYLRDETISARPASAVYQLRKFARRHRGLVAGVASVLVVLLVGTIVSVGFGIQSTLARREADEQTAIAETVNEFLNVDLLRSVDPDLGRRDVTVLEVLDNASAAIGGRFRGRPRVEAAIRLTLGETYLNLGEYETAEEHLVAARGLLESQLGSDHVSTLDALNQLGILRSRQARYEESVALHARTREGYGRALGPDHVMVTASLNQLGVAQREMGDYANARESLEEALARQLSLHGEQTAESVAILSNLANLYYLMGRHGEAEKTYLRARELRARVFGEDSHRSLNTLEGMALVYMRQGRNQDAEPILRKVLKTSEAAYGPDHPRTLGTRARLATATGALGKLDEAKELYESALEGRRRELGDDHPDTLSTWCLLGDLHVDRGDYAQAELCLSTALSGQRRVRGPDHEETQITKLTLANLYSRQRRHPQAKELQEEVYDSRRRVLGPDHPDTLTAGSTLARSLLTLRDLEKAEELARTSHEGLARERGENHPDTLMSLQCLGEVYAAREKHEAAAKTWEDALARMRQVYGDQHPNTIMTTNNLAYLYDKIGRYEDAAPLFQAALDAQRQVAGDTHPRTWMFMLSLSNLYRKSEDHDEAVKRFRRYIEDLRQAHGDAFGPLLNFHEGLALTYEAQARYEDAEEVWLEMYEFALRVLGPRHGAMKKVIGSIADFYGKWNKPEKAAEWRAKLQTVGS